MQRTRLFKSLAIIAAAGLSFAACGDDEESSSTTAGSSGDATLCDASKGPAEKTEVKLQLQWFTQAQFAGYYAAVAQGCYAELVSTSRFCRVQSRLCRKMCCVRRRRALAWVPKALASREAGANIVNMRRSSSAAERCRSVQDAGIVARRLCWPADQ